MDDMTSDPAIDAMISCLASGLCRRRDFDKSEHEDLCQEMRLALLADSGDYDSDRGSMRGWAHTLLGRWAGSEVRRRTAAKRRDMYRSASLDVSASDGEASISDVLSSDDMVRRNQIEPTSASDIFDMADTIRAASVRLDPGDLNVWRLLADNTAAQVARDLGLTAYAVRQAKNRIRESIELVTNQEKL